MILLKQSHNDIHHRNASLLIFFSFFCFLSCKKKQKTASCVSLEELTTALLCSALLCSALRLPELIDFRGELLNQTEGEGEKERTIKRQKREKGKRERDRKRGNPPFFSAPRGGLFIQGLTEGQNTPPCYNGGDPQGLLLSVCVCV